MSFMQNPVTPRPVSKKLDADTFYKTPAGRRTSNEFGKATAAASGVKDAAAFGAMGNLGIAAQNAMGQYGVSRNNALANNTVAAANAYGAMANNYQNTLGQLGYLASNLSAAGLNAGAQSAQGRQNSNVNFNMGGNASFGGGGGLGFNASGPEGTIASGSYGGGGGGSFGGSMGGGGMSSEMTRGASPEERTGMVNQGYGFIDQLRGDLNNPENQAMALAGLMGDEFRTNRAAIMDPSIMNSLNYQLDTGYGALSDLYGMSDYGFNTLSDGYKGSYSPDQGISSYWMNPDANRPLLQNYNPGGRFL